MEKVTVADWDLAEVLETKEDIAVSLEVALAEKDTGFLFETLGALARSEGMSQIARELGVTREGLYKSLSPNGNPSFETVLNLLDVLGLQLRLEPKTA
ncbi:MAG: putative addiction module antidote protein [Spirochaetales bacterium]|jgi:probable addiction module antidote protein|nr:putative addiction module antidote protein [Spirochaetales bacterium]